MENVIGMLSTQNNHVLNFVHDGQLIRWTVHDKISIKFLSKNTD